MVLFSPVGFPTFCNKTKSIKNNPHFFFSLHLFSETKIYDQGIAGFILYTKGERKVVR